MTSRRAGLAFAALALAAATSSLAQGVVLAAIGFNDRRALRQYAEVRVAVNVLTDALTRRNAQLLGIQTITEVMLDL